MKPDLKDICFLLGAALLVAGVAVIYWPAALIIAGIGLLLAGVR